VPPACATVFEGRTYQQELPGAALMPDRQARGPAGTRQAEFTGYASAV